MIPAALRPILGQNEFKKSLGTSNKTQAELRAAPLILHWKKLIEDAKTDGVTTKAKALRSALDNSPNNDLIAEALNWSQQLGAPTVTYRPLSPGYAPTYFSVPASLYHRNFTPSSSLPDLEEA